MDIPDADYLGSLGNVVQVTMTDVLKIPEGDSMKLDLEELKRLQGESLVSIKRSPKFELVPLTREMREFRDGLVLQFPAILAKLEAAQNEREQLNEQLRKMGADWLATAINGAAESLPVARIRGLVEQHGSYRKVGELLGVDHAYLHRIVSGEKDNMSDALLRKIGLRRGTFYVAFDKEQQ